MLGIMAALPQEIEGLLKQMSGHTRREIGSRTFHVGKIANIECVVVLARVGKVAASVTCTTLIQTFGVDRIILTGLAGAVSTALKIGDIVMATSLCQHDFNAEPLFPRYEIPFLGKQYFDVDEELSQRLSTSATQFIEGEHNFSLQKMLSTRLIESFGLQSMKVYHGIVLSGDQFIGSNEAVRDLQQRFPQALCTEMEGAAVAQVCYEHQVPFAVFRVISDKANHDAWHDFSLFLDQVAPFISSGVLLQFLMNS